MYDSTRSNARYQTYIKEKKRTAKQNDSFFAAAVLKKPEHQKKAIVSVAKKVQCAARTAQTQAEAAKK